MQLNFKGSLSGGGLTVESNVDGFL